MEFFSQADVDILCIILYYILEMGTHTPIIFDLQYFLLRLTFVVFAMP